MKLHVNLEFATRLTWKSFEFCKFLGFQMILTWKRFVSANLLGIEMKARAGELGILLKLEILKKVSYNGLISALRLKFA